MRLPGRIAAAAEILEDMQTRHRPAAEALKDWGLSHRFAGAGDRAAIGNLVYDALRHRSSTAWRMGGDTPWHLAVGTAILDGGQEPAALAAAFAADPHAPAPISEDCISRLASCDIGAAPEAVRADVPDWLEPQFRAAFGADWVEEGRALAERPPLDLRVNLLKGDREKALRQLGHPGIVPTPHSPVGLRIPAVTGARRHPNVQAEEAFQRGRVEIQDEGSQLCALLTGARPGEQVLDFCAGAGGKALALAACMQNRGQIFAYDADRSRLAPIFERVKRAGARNIQIRAPRPGVLDDLAGRMDRVLVDAPCSGTGTWRRRPDSKWRLSPDSLQRRLQEQAAVLAEAAVYVRPGGILAYATCSLLPAENMDQIEAFLAAQPQFALLPAATAWAAALPQAAAPIDLSTGAVLLSPRRSGTDGFFLVLLRRTAPSSTGSGADPS